MTPHEFEETMRLYYPRVLAYARSMVSAAAAPDIAQETFIAAYKHGGRYSEQGKTLAWLRAIARNIALRHLHREARFTCVPLESEAPVLVAGGTHSRPEASFLQDEGYQHILHVIHKLPPHQQTVVYQRVVQGLPVAQVAQDLQIPAGSVKSKMHYGLHKVRTALKDYLIEGAFMMECTQAYAYLFQYAKQAILPADKEKVATHLAACPHCKGIADSLAQLLPHIKPAPQDMLRHYNITFSVPGDRELCYFGMASHIKNYARLNEVLQQSGGVVPPEEIWFCSGFDKGVQHLAEFDNDGNRVEVDITPEDGNNRYMRKRYTKMTQVFEYHQTNSVSLSANLYDTYTRSADAPNLYVARTANRFGQHVKSGLYLALPVGATNIRMKQGCDVVVCGAHSFIYDDRYVTDTQAVNVECTYNM